MNNNYPTVATILGCPEELQSADGLVATPIVLGSNNEEMEVSEPSVKQLLPSDTSQIKDPIQKALVDNILGKLPTKSVQEKFKCQLCNVEVNCRPAYLTHLSGAKHAKRLKEEQLKSEVESPHIKYVEEKKMYQCILCSTELNAKIQISAHLQGTKHRNKAGIKDNTTKSEAGKLGNNAAKNPSAKMGANKTNGTFTQDTTSTGQLLFCSTCNLHTNSDHQYQQHLASKKHLNKVNMKKSGPIKFNDGSSWFIENKFNRLTPYYKPKLPAHLKHYMQNKGNYFESASTQDFIPYSKQPGYSQNNSYVEGKHDVRGIYGHYSYRNHPSYNSYS